MARFKSVSAVREAAIDQLENTPAWARGWPEPSTIISTRKTESKMQHVRCRARNSAPDRAF